MLPWPKLAGLFAVLVTSAALLLAGCSSSSPRDIHYGTDVGLGFVPPDVAPTVPDSAAIDAGVSAIDSAAIDAGTSAEVSLDVATGIDGGVQVDVSIDGAN